MIRWGIIGAGKIAHRFVKALSYEKNSSLYAVSCRTYDKAKRFADMYDCPIAYAGFDSVVNDENIDAVYIAVPHAYHKEWIIRCLKAGKPVLCEKPLALNEEEVKEIIAVQKDTGVLCMEAMKTRFVPLYKEIMRIVQDGTIGELKEVSASFCSSVDMDNKEGYYMKPVGGGALLDVGIYCSSWIAAFAEKETELKWLRANVQNGVDIYTDAALKSDSVLFYLECALDRKKERTMVIKGTKGSIFVPQFHRPEKAKVYANNEQHFAIEKPYVHDDMFPEVSAFAELLLQKKTESRIMPLTESQRCARILDQIRAGYTYSQDTMSFLLKQEEMLQFASFDYEDARRLADIVLDLQKQYDRQISLSVIDEEKNLEIVRIMQNGKTEKNLMYMNGKRKCALECGHSSLYGAVKNIVTGKNSMSNSDICYAGGAFPIRVQREWKYTICVSGLHEGKDHELIVRALSHMLQKEMTPFPYRMI